MSIRDLAVACLATTLITACSLHPAREPIAEDEKVLHLENQDALQFRVAGDTTRPSMELQDGERRSWLIPPGPARVVRTAYSKAADGGELSARTGSGAGTAVAKCEVIGGRDWTPWEFAVPASTQPSRLDLRFRDVSHNGPIVLAQPTLSSAAKSSPRIFILIVVDTLRKDHLSIYGYPRQTTPNIDQYFKNGIIWTNAFSNIDWTLPSHVTMFSSTLPSGHGVGLRTAVIPPTLPLLAERLQAAGYRTLAMTNGGYTDPIWGFDRGFDIYRSTSTNIADEVASLTSRLREFAGEPIFVFLHTYQVHDYTPSPWAATHFPASVGDLGPRWTKAPFDSIREFALRYPGSWRPWLLERYDASVYDVDHSFGTLTDFVERAGLLSRTSILVTSDHGEELFDRPTASDDPYTQFGHSRPGLYDNVLRIPLLLSTPENRSGRVESANVSLLDLAPTILSILGLESPAAFHGKSLWPGPRNLEPRIVVAEHVSYDAVAARQGRLKMIRRGPGPFENPWSYSEFDHLPELECFDTDADAREQRALPCDSRFDRLRIAVDRRIIQRFPGSIVSRLKSPENGIPSPLYLEGSEGVDPAVRSFGLPPGSIRKFGTGRTTVKFKSTGPPQYVALAPERGARQVILSLYCGERCPEGFSNVRPELAYGWADLESAQSVSNPLSIFTTGLSVFGTSPYSPSADLVRRLEALGYLNAGNHFDSKVAAPSSSDASSGDEPHPLSETIAVRLLEHEPEWSNDSEPVLEAQIPVIDRLDPPHATAGATFGATRAAGFNLEVHGRNFMNADRVWWDLEMLPTEFVNSRLLRAVVPADRLNQVSRVQVSVKPPSFLRFSRPAIFPITAR